MPSVYTPSAFKNLADSLKPAFPKLAPMQLMQMGIEASQEDQAANQSFSQTHIGYRLSKSDDSRVLQIRHDGFAYSHMAPYTDWDTFRAEAYPLWLRYKEACPGALATRCAVRYINRVDIPGKTIEIEDYFKLHPEIPDSLPQPDVVGMTMMLQMPQSDLGCMAVINQSQVPPIQPDHVAVLLDIDVFRLAIETWTDSELWEFLDKLRLRKNEIFEGCITDRMRELIDR